MYSNNDYRYYLEHRLAESDDFLAHYGVKGMKWKNHKSPGELLRNAAQGVENHVRDNQIYNNQQEYNRYDKKIKKTEKKLEKKLKKIDKKTKKIKKNAEKRMSKPKRERSKYEKKINNLKNHNTVYDKAKREGVKYAKGVRKEAREAYEGQKKDIQRIARNVKKSDTYKSVKKKVKKASKKIARSNRPRWDTNPNKRR